MALAPDIRKSKHLWGENEAMTVIFIIPGILLLWPVAALFALFCKE